MPMLDLPYSVSVYIFADMFGTLNVKKAFYLKSDFGIRLANQDKRCNFP